MKMSSIVFIIVYLGDYLWYFPLIGVICK